MSTATLTFTLPEELSDFETAVHASDYRSALVEISQRVFRPARKHGYQDSNIQQLLESTGEAGKELVAALEKLFWEVLRDNSVDRLD
jgi:hypothetical protein